MITVVCGPPCGGKSTWAQENTARFELLLDFDKLAMALGASDRHYDGEFRQSVYLCWLAIRAQILSYKSGVIVHGMPGRHDLSRYREHNARIVLVDPGREVVYERIKDRPREHREFADRFYDGYNAELQESVAGYDRFIRASGQ